MIMPVAVSVLPNPKNKDSSPSSLLSPLWASPAAALQDHPNPRTLATENAVRKAALETLKQLKEVWAFHFGIRLIYGQEYRNGPVTQENIMINRDNTIVEKIIKLFHEWKYLERLSRCPDIQGNRTNSGKSELQKKEIDFKELASNINNWKNNSFYFGW